MAEPFKIAPELIENDDVQITTEGGTFVLEHRQSGATFEYDSNAALWMPSSGVKSAIFQADDTVMSVAGDDGAMTDKDAKVIGELADEGGIGLLGINMAEEGDAIGVYGETESEDGYGLYTPDDAHVGGTVEADTVESGEVSTDQVDIGEDSNDDDLTVSGAGNEWIFREDGGFETQFVEQEQNSAVLGWDGSGDRQTIPSGDGEIVEWTTVEIEDDDLFDVDLENNEITVLFDGRVTVSAYFRWDDSTDFGQEERVTPQILKNGNRVKRADRPTISGDVFTTDVPDSEFSVSSGDTFSIEVFQYTGSDQQLDQSSSVADRIAQFKVRRTA